MMDLKVMVRSLLVVTLGLGLSLAVLGCGERDEEAPAQNGMTLPSYDEATGQMEGAAEETAETAEEAAAEAREAAEQAAKEAEEAAKKAADEASAMAEEAAEEAAEKADEAGEAVRGMGQ